jgi:pilus assembly protein Flp/PilA
VAETKSPKKEDMHMKDKLLKLSVMLQILKDENGQDLIEYALMVAVISFAATVGMKSLANSMNLAFTHIGTRLTTYIT